MSSLKDKLDYLNDTKHLIAEALKNNGADITDTDTFRSYADKITELNAFKPLDICNITVDNASVLNTSRIYFYKQNKEYSYINTDRSYDLICHNYSQKLGIYVTGIDNDNVHVNAKFIVASEYSDEYISTLLSDNNWRLKTKNAYKNIDFVRDKNDIFYNDTELQDIHPFLSNSGLSEIKKEIKIPFDINKLKISDVYNTEISIDKDIMFLFNEGNKHIYVFPSMDRIIFIKTDSGYTFQQNSYTYPLSRFPFKSSWYDKARIAYDQSTGVRGINIDQDVLVSTKDIYDENGNLLFEKNASIEDFI